MCQSRRSVAECRRALKRQSIVVFNSTIFLYNADLDFPPRGSVRVTLRLPWKLALSCRVATRSDRKGFVLLSSDDSDQFCCL